jgi:hypothetical protein
MYLNVCATSTWIVDHARLALAQQKVDERQLLKTPKSTNDQLSRRPQSAGGMVQVTPARSSSVQQRRTDPLVAPGVHLRQVLHGRAQYVKPVTENVADTQIKGGQLCRPAHWYMCLQIFECTVGGQSCGGCRRPNSMRRSL